VSRAVCPNCGQSTASAHEVSGYHYKESGLDNVWLFGGVTKTECTNCRKSSIRITKEPQLLQVIALDLLIRPGSRSGTELRFLRRACGLSQAELARLLKSPRRETIADREAKSTTGLNFAEEVGLRWVLVQAFHDYVTTPGNCALEGSHLEMLWSFAGLFREFAGNSKVERQRTEKITARVRQNAWTVETKKSRAA
jgi:DNA-binding transcriptional regulator YiaG